MLTAVLVAGLACVSAKEWQIVPDTLATTLVGVGADTDTNGVAGACNSGTGPNSGAFAERWTGETVKKEHFDGGMILDIATDATYTVAMSMLPIMISKDAGKTYTSSETLGGMGQSCDVTDGIISMVGSFTPPRTEGEIPVGTMGVARSEDGGNSWFVSPVDAWVRYGAYPSKNVWYTSNGFWPTDSASAERAAEETKHRRSHRMSSRVTVSEKGATIRDFTNGAKLGSNTTSAGESLGYTASITKTVDGGLTWTTVFPQDDNNNFYFNQIACSSETHCVAVAEGEDEVGGYDIRAYVTFDGGETWTNSLPKEIWPEGTEMVSISGAAWINDQEGWLGATSKTRQMLEGIFFHTTDGGKTYEVAQQLTDCYIMDMDFAETVGYCSCLSSSGSSGSLGMYV